MEETIQRIVIVGSGNLAEALARALAQSDLEVVQLFARNPDRGRIVAQIAGTTWTSDPEKLAQANLYLLAVSDKAVAQVAASLPIAPTAIIAHTAGSVPLDALPAKHLRRAVFYPLQTFTAGREIDFRQVPVFIETADPDLHEPFSAFARKLSDKVSSVNSTQRAKIHLAGVFACNFANHMFAMGEAVLRNAGLSYDLLKPLIGETAAKALQAASPADVQTGPAVRNDFATRARHIDMLADDLRMKNLYSSISQSIWETSKKI